MGKKKSRSGIQKHTHNKLLSASGLEPSSFIVCITPVGLRFGNSQPQSFATWVLSPPACGHPDGSHFCHTHSAWMRAPWSTRLHPRGTAVVMVTQPITVTEGGPGRTGCHRWLFQSLVKPRLGPSLVLLATDLDPDPRLTNWGFSGTCGSEAKSGFWPLPTLTEQF